MSFEPQNTAGAADAARSPSADEEPVWLIPVSFWPRVGARIIDILVSMALAAIIGILVGIILVVLQETGIVPGALAHRTDKSSVLSNILFTLGLVGYHAACEAIGGATIGKLVLGIRVCSPNSTPCTVKGAIIRSFAFLIDGLFFGIVAYSTMSKSSLRQRLGDQWGDTLVVRASSLPKRAPGGQVALGIVAGIAVYSAVTFVTLLVDGF